MDNSLAYKLKEDKLACKIQKESGCTWKEAFERAERKYANKEEK